MNKRKNILFIAGCALFLICNVWLVFFYRLVDWQTHFKIKTESGVYYGDLEVQIQLPKGQTLYYTTDGSLPEKSSKSTMVYAEPLILEASDDGSPYYLQFLCEEEDGTLSATVERTYLVLSEDHHITTDYVISVQGDSDELFSDEKGIFVRGKQFYDYLEANPNPDLNTVLIPANYFSNTELPVHASIFTRQGSEIISQDCGVKIYGNYTRAKNQKSFRLIARYDYDDSNEFNYTFFDRLISTNSNSSISSFQRLSLHNAGDDNGYGFIRNTLCNELARQVGFPDVLVSKSATVYINDRYMGVYWLQNDYDDKYFKEKYGTYNGEMVICEGTLSTMQVADTDTLQQQEDASRYNDFCAWVLASDVNDASVWEKINANLDVDNYLQYMAIEYYINNMDWPTNNVKVYRYLPSDGESYKEGTAFDGKWRYLLFDLDYGMGLKFQGWFGKSAEDRFLDYLLDNPDSSGIFPKLMEREDCRGQFINYVLALRNTAFQPENVSHVLDDFNGSRYYELDYMMGHTDILKDSLWESDDNNIDNVNLELQKIKRYAEDRQYHVLIEMMDTWSCGFPVPIVSDSLDEYTLLVNGKPNQENAYFFSQVPITISAKSASPDRKVTHWDVNGVTVEGEIIELLPADYLQDSDTLYVQPYFEDSTPFEQLEISAFSTNGNQDWVRLTNTGTTIIHLSDYYLSDNEDNPTKGKLPSVNLKSGESVTLYGKEYKGEMENSRNRLDFSWNSEEPILLSHTNNGIIETRYR